MCRSRLRRDLLVLPPSTNPPAHAPQARRERRRCSELHPAAALPLAGALRPAYRDSILRAAARQVGVSRPGGKDPKV